MNDSNQNEARNEALSRALQPLKEDDRAMSTSPAVEARLREEVRRLRTVERRTSPNVIAALAAAAIVVLTISITWWNRVEPAPEVVAAQEVTTEFYPLFYGSVPARQTHLVRLEVPRDSLARLGLMSADAMNRAAGTVLADVLVGDDGLARAVRFVQKRVQEQKQ